MTLQTITGVASPYIMPYKTFVWGQHQIHAFVEPLVNDAGYVTFKCLKSGKTKTFNVPNVDSVVYDIDCLELVEKVDLS